MSFIFLSVIYYINHRLSLITKQLCNTQLINRQSNLSRLNIRILLFKVPQIKRATTTCEKRYSEKEREREHHDPDCKQTILLTHTQVDNHLKEGIGLTISRIMIRTRIYIVQVIVNTLPSTVLLTKHSHSRKFEISYFISQFQKYTDCVPTPSPMAVISQ